MNKKYTEKTAAACCRRLLKSAGKVAGDLAHGWTDSKGRQCFSDGYRAYMLNRPLQGLPTEDKHLAAAPLEKIFSALDGGDVITIPAPDADALKAFQAAGKGEPWSLGEDLPTVDPEYIADALRLFPGGKNEFRRHETGSGKAFPDPFQIQRRRVIVRHDHDFPSPQHACAPGARFRQQAPADQRLIGGGCVYGNSFHLASISSFRSRPSFSSAFSVSASPAFRASR